MTTLKRKHLLGLEGMSADELREKRPDVYEAVLGD